MSGRSPSPLSDRRSLTPIRGRSFSPRSRSSSRSYSRSRSRSPSYNRRSRRHSPYSYRRRYYSRSPRPPYSSSSRRYRSRSPPPMRRNRANKECRVYVGNLPFEVTWHQLKDFMRDAGQVVHVDVLKMPNGRSKGCGVVEYRHPEEAKRAIHMMNKAEFMGRPVFVREDREYDNSIPDHHHSRGPPKDPRDAPEDCVLHVSNLPLNASWQDMKDLFRKAGRVLHTDIHTELNSRRPNGHGTVIYDDSRLARTAIDMFHGYEWQGYVLSVVEGRYNDPNTSTTTAPVIVSPPIEQQYTTPSIIPPAVAETYTMYNNTPPPPPPPPLYTQMSLVGGPAANLPTHGHNQIFVNNLPFSTTWQDLIDLFRHVGPVVRSEICTMNGHPKGSGFVRFEDAATCDRAIEKFHGYMYGGRHLDIRLDKYSTSV